MKVNYERIKEITGDDVEMIKTLISLYIDSFNKNIQDIESALNTPNQNAEKIWHNAIHDLKGSSYNLGFTELGDYCKKIEGKGITEAKKKEILSEVKSVLLEVIDIYTKLDR